MKHPSNTPFKASFTIRFFGIRYHYSQSGALTIYDCMRPALRKGYLMPKKRFLKGGLKGVLEGCLITWLGLQQSMIVCDPLWGKGALCRKSGKKGALKGVLLNDPGLNSIVDFTVLPQSNWRTTVQSIKWTVYGIVSIQGCQKLLSIFTFY